MRAVGVPEGDGFGLTNPATAPGPMEKSRGDTPPPDSVVIGTTYRDNPFLSPEMRTELEYDRRRDPDKFAWVWEGKYVRNSEARVFRNWKIEEFDIDPQTVTLTLTSSPSGLQLVYDGVYVTTPAVRHPIKGSPQAMARFRCSGARSSWARSSRWRLPSRLA